MDNVKILVQVLTGRGSAKHCHVNAHVDFSHHALTDRSMKHFTLALITEEVNSRAFFILVTLGNAVADGGGLLLDHAQALYDTPILSDRHEGTSKTL